MWCIHVKAIGGLQPIPGDPKDNGVAAMLDDRTFCFVIQHGCHTVTSLFGSPGIGCKPPTCILVRGLKWFAFGWGGGGGRGDYPITDVHVCCIVCAICRGPLC